MEILDISSLGMTYRYAVNIEQKFEQEKWDFGFANPRQGKGTPKTKKKDKTKARIPRKTHQSCKKRKTPRR